MAIELMQVVTPADEAVELWLDVDAALAIGLAQDKASSAIYDVRAALKLEDEDEVDVAAMTTVRLTLDTESLELFLQPGALEDLEASAQAVPADEAAAKETEAVPEAVTEAVTEEETAEEADLKAYIQEMITWFPQAFDGWVYNSGDPTQTLAKQVAIGSIAAASDERDNPPSWDARALLSYADGGGELGTYLVTFMVEDGVPYAYLDRDSFAEVNAMMLAEPAAADEDADVGEVAGPVEEVAEPLEEAEPEDDDALPAKAEAAALLQAASRSDDTRRELFWRAGASAAIDDYEISLIDADSVVGKIGDELAGERGWWISPQLRVVPVEGDDEPIDVTITAAKLLITDDNKSAWIELAADDI